MDFQYLVPLEIVDKKYHLSCLLQIMSQTLNVHMSGHRKNFYPAKFTLDGVLLSLHSYLKKKFDFK